VDENRFAPEAKRFFSDSIINTLFQQVFQKTNATLQAKRKDSIKATFSIRKQRFGEKSGV
jgi:hypothetical protein